MKTIEDTSNLFIKQIMITKYFLIKIGINIKNYNEDFDDSFFNNFSEFKKNDFDIDIKESSNTLNNILNTIISLLNNKIIIDDILLIICFVLEHQYQYNKLWIMNHLQTIFAPETS